MKRFRSVIALALSLALVVVSPGSSAYHAAAQTIGAAANGSASAGVSGVSGASLGRANGVSAIPALAATSLNLSSALSAPSIVPSALPNAAVPAAPAAARTPVAPKAASPVAAAKAVQGAIAAPAKSVIAAAVSSLHTVVSGPAADSKSAETQAAEAALQFDGAFAKKKDSSKGMPDQDVDENGKPSRDGGVDELGNPRRTGGEGGPDDRSDPDQDGRGGGDGLFGALRSGRLNAFAIGDRATVSLRSAKKESGKGMPDQGLDENGRPSRDGGVDELGNPRRTGGEGGPDDRSDPDQSDRGGNSGLFGLFGVGLLGGAAAAVAGLSFGSIAMFPMIIASLILHEIGHARMADKLGDPTARLQNRASFNPRHWMTHIDPVWTLLIPAATFLFAGMIFGGARPVPVEPRYFKNPVKDMALVALAGPAVNMGLAAAGALAVTGAVAAGLGTAVIATLGMFVFLNVLLAIFNLIPMPPLDGSHMLKAVLPYKARAAMDNVMDRLGPMGMLLPMLVIFMVAGGAIAGAAMLVAKLMIGGVMAVTGVQMASAFLPAVAALGLAVGQIGAGQKAGRAAAQEAAAPGPSGPSKTGAASNGGNAPVDLIVMFGDKKTKLHDSHISNVDVNLPSGVEQYTRLQQAMLAQLETAGLDAFVLEPYKATPLATYARINAATIRVDGASAAEFMKSMAARGFAVYPNAERKIIRPVPVSPEDMDPGARNAVTMDENLRIVKADLGQAEAEKMWGKPVLGFWSGLWAKVFKTEAPQPKFGVIDSGADTSHPLLKRVKEVKNMTSGENVDDIGHGSWVHSTVLHMAPWSRNTTHYKTFLNGGATLDDILKALTQAGNDGNLVISNSWGDDEGDPNGPDAQLVKKLAQEGHIMVFAAGNAGSGKNTIGAPAIVTYKDPTTGAIRVVSVAAAGRDKKIAYFSSRGPGSPKTSKDPSYKDHRPDLTAVGYNIEGAWPSALGDADRVDGEKGPVKAISGTSMSTPGVAGAIALLAMMFGATEIGPKLDAVVNAVMSTLEKTGQSPDAEGEGFMNVDAAYKKLKSVFSTPARDVSSYRAMKSRLSELDGFIAMSGSWKYGVMIDSGEFSRALQERKSVAAALAAMEADHPGIAYRSKGAFGRWWERVNGRAPKR
ncbi:MAG: S8 family serine peptidase [Elusimicrobia bacterium]|nr:S8 family serine peptidase [Elusimicrobiota bacterium]